ncbi:hypothetical protein [Spartinivicinus ruber]|uniref:hypothetical protein n=1 Tax=Spartinivicinus ruber TaxID=2683272 RepID=UPI0013D17BAE|nr:hypothetical protein [Spartinivicinus ruber]
MDIRKELAAWDGKSKAIISIIYDTHYIEIDFADSIIELINYPDFQKGATWLLKAYLEEGHCLQKKQIKCIYGYLKKLANWESKLHILQSLPFMPIAKVECKKVEQFLRETLTDKNKFIRAWGYNGFYILAKQYPVSLLSHKIETKKA